MQNDTVLLAPCNEKGREVYRRVSLFEPTPANMLEAVDKLNQVPNFLNSQNQFEAFLREDSYALCVDDVGMLLVSHMQYGYSASVHITFWDRRLRGREKLCRIVADWVVRFAGLKFVWTAIPANSRSVIAFAKRIGFKIVQEQNGVVLLHYTRRV